VHDRLVPIRVVVADDVDDLRFLLRMAFEASGDFEVVGEAATGSQALRVVAEQRPDVLVLDLDMPNMTGFEALPFLRAQNPDTAVVVYSAFVIPGAVVDELLRQGAAAVVPKDVTPRYLTERVASVLAA
jgi:DNA-binding NarL/FixJ family response regulator